MSSFPKFKEFHRPMLIVRNTRNYVFSFKSGPSTSYRRQSFSQLISQVYFKACQILLPIFIIRVITWVGCCKIFFLPRRWKTCGLGLWSVTKTLRTDYCSQINFSWAERYSPTIFGFNSTFNHKLLKTLDRKIWF